MGEALRRGAEDRRGGRRALTGRRGTWRRRVRTAAAALLLAALAPLTARAQDDAPVRLTDGRFTVVAFPGDEGLARSLLAAAVASDTFPGLPRPQQPALIAIAPDARRFREWIGPGAPEWGAAIAFPEARRIVMQGRRSGSDAGNPLAVLRHEIAHLALHEFMGDLPPRWFDEGYAAYAARESAREELLATNFALALRGVPGLEDLDGWFAAGEQRAQTAYALAYRAVSDIAALDPQRGLALFLAEWRTRGTMDGALRAAYGTTLGSFEQGWVRRTRMRYGILALFADMTLTVVALLAVILPLYVVRRRRDRARMAALIAADRAAEAAERESALAAFLGDDPALGEGERPSPPEGGTAPPFDNRG